MLYDSFGRLPSAQWQPRLQGIETTDLDPEQPPLNPDGSKTEFCGQACLAFALVRYFCYDPRPPDFELAQNGPGGR